MQVKIPTSKIGSSLHLNDGGVIEKSRNNCYQNPCLKSGFSDILNDAYPLNKNQL